MSKLLIPNTCQVPNVLLDEIMPRLPGVPLKVLLAIVRQTYGFGIESKQIGLKRLAELTGLSVQSVLNGLEALEGLVTIKRGPRNSRVQNDYALNLDISTGQLLKQFDYSNHLTSQIGEAGLLKSVDSLKPSIKPNKKSGAKAPESSSNKRSRKTTRGAGTVPPELQPAVSRVVARINELAGTTYKPDSKIVTNGLVPRLRKDATELDCIAVVEDRWREWENKADMRQYFNPETLFRESNFEKYLNAARMSGAAANGNGHDKPAQLKDLGGGMVEVDGLKMLRKDYERKYGRAAV
jgi:uncharacterized phage protein (TIGR02220 family)